VANVIFFPRLTLEELMHIVNTQHPTTSLMSLKKTVIHKIHKITRLTVLRTYKVLHPTIASRSHEAEPIIHWRIYSYATYRYF